MSSKFQALQSPRGKRVTVKIGFCWPAFFFGALWAIYHRLWSISARLIVVWVSLIVIDESVVKPSQCLPLLIAMLVAYVIYVVVCGKFGNAWRANHLLSRGYIRVKPPRNPDPAGSRESNPMEPLHEEIQIH